MTGPTGVARLPMDAQLTVIARPLTAVHTKVEARLFLINLKNHVEQIWPVPLRHVGSGVFTLREQIDRLPPLAPGAWQVVLVVAAAGELPSTLQDGHAGPLVERTQAQLDIWQ